MRVTDAMRLSTVLRSEANASERLSRLQEMAASGQRVSAPSDDPAAFASLEQRGAQMGVVKARGEAATRAAGDLDLAESTLDAAGSLMDQARSIAVEAANGTQDAASRASAAKQITSIQQQLIALANTRGATGFLFGGTKTATPPFDAAGAFHGNAGVTHVEIADGVLATSNASGANAFTAAGGRDVFGALGALASALAANDVTGIRSSIGDMDAGSKQIVAARVDVGTSAGRLHSAADVSANALTQLQAAQSAEGDADIPATLTNLQAAQTAYESALQVTKQVLSVSLTSANIG
jgi:flagellar hook-associated protein 3 FlgL